MHRPRRGDDEVAVEEADGGGTAVDLPDVGLNRAGDDVDQRLGALRACHLLFVVGAATPLEQASTAAPASAASLLTGAGDVEVGTGEVRDFDEQILHRIDARDQLPVGHFTGGDFDDALIDVKREQRSALPAGFIQDQVEHLADLYIPQANVQRGAFVDAGRFERLPVDVEIGAGDIADVIDRV